VKVYVEMVCRDSIESTNKQTHMLRGNREAKMALVLKRYMKTSRRAAKTAMESHGY